MLVEMLSTSCKNEKEEVEKQCATKYRGVEWWLPTSGLSAHESRRMGRKSGLDRRPSEDNQRKIRLIEAVLENVLLILINHVLHGVHYT